MDKARELFAKNITQLRERLGLRQEEVAEQLGINTRTYQKYEYGKAYPRPSKLERLSEILNTTPSNLLSSANPAYAEMLKRHDSDRSSLILDIQARLTALNEKQLRLIDGFIDDLLIHDAGADSSTSDVG